ncbi:GNAT family N-acetyltransferase [Flavobacterium anhuiense]
MRNSTFRGLGIGKKLLTEAVDFCKEKSLKMCFCLRQACRIKHSKCIK